MSYGTTYIQGGESPMQDKEITKKIRKEIKNILVKLLTQSLIQDNREKDPNGLTPVNSNSKPERSESLTDCVNVHGLLINAVTKKKDIIVGARTEHFAEGMLVFYTIDTLTSLQHFLLLEHIKVLT